MRWTVLFVFALAACGVGGPPGGGGPGHGGEHVEAPPTVVEVADADTGSVSELLLTHATVESEAQADLFPQAPGTVLEVRRDEGDVVRRGDVLAVVENPSLDASASRTRADLAKLESDLQSLEALHSQGAISDRELADFRHNVEVARVSAREAGRSYGHTRISAPFDGVVAVREVRVGEYASSGQRAFQVVDMDRLRVVASLPEREVSKVHLGQPARLTAAYDPDCVATAEVVRISPVIDPTSGTFRVTLDIDPDQDVLRPGQYVSVALETARHQGVLVVPREAVVWEDGTPVAYRMVPAPEPEDGEEEGAVAVAAGAGGFQLDLSGLFGGGGDEDQVDAGAEEEDDLPDFVAERVPLELGLLDDRSAEIEGGLDAGDAVIVVGQSALRDGASVLTPAMQAERAARDAEAEDAGGEGEVGG